MTRKNFRLTHEYNIGDRDVYFTFDEQKNEFTATELAVYLQFKAEETFDNSICLDAVTIIRFLSSYGAKQLNEKPSGEFITIDMHWDRESRCGDWYADKWRPMDVKLRDQTTEFLQAEAKSNQLMGELEN